MNNILKLNKLLKGSIMNNIFKVMAITSTFFLISGCQNLSLKENKKIITTENREELEKILEFRNTPYLIYVNRDGMLLNPEDEGLGKNYLSEEAEQKYINKIIMNFKIKNKMNDKPLKLVVFIHGGLNFRKYANLKPDKFKEIMLKDGYYPLFISWNSGAFTSYKDHLFRIRKGEAKPIKAAITSPLVFAEDVGRSILQSPSAYDRELRKYSSIKELKKLPTTTQYKNLTNYLSSTGFKIIDKNYEYQHNAYSIKDILKPVKLVTKATTAPFVNGLGKGTWGALLRRADLVFNRPVKYENLNIPEQFEIKATDMINKSKSQATLVSQDTASLRDTAAAKFFKTWQNDAELESVEITVIGHSMGTIVANNIVARYPKLNVNNLVYMGAAARVKDVESVVVPWLYHNRDSHFYNLSLDPVREISEPVGRDFVPQGSLLNWIDNIFGDINSPKDKTAGTWTNMLLSADDIFLNDKALREQVTLTKFPFGREIDGPQKHGAFDEYLFWKDGFWKGNKYCYLQADISIDKNIEQCETGDERLERKSS